ncbi:hypothetical protein ACNKHK_04260 [Shigella flexneri]
MGTHWWLWLGKTWPPLADENFHTGLGFTAGFTARDNWNYIPVPAVTAAGIDRVWSGTLQMTYIPVNYRTVMFTLRGMRFQF